jgi:hypothetical protein
LFLGSAVVPENLNRLIELLNLQWLLQNRDRADLKNPIEDLAVRYTPHALSTLDTSESRAGTVQATGPSKWHISKFGWNRLMSIVPVTNIKGVTRVVA